MGHILDYPPLFKSGHLGGVYSPAPGTWGGGEGGGVTWLRASVPSRHFLVTILRSLPAPGSWVKFQGCLVPFSLSFLFPRSTSRSLLTEATARVSPDPQGSTRAIRFLAGRGARAMDPLVCFLKEWLAHGPGSGSR